MEEKAKLARARIQKETAYKIVIKNYAYLVGHIDAVRIFPPSGHKQTGRTRLPAALGLQTNGQGQDDGAAAGTHQEHRGDVVRRVHECTVESPSV